MTDRQEFPADQAPPASALSATPSVAAALYWDSFGYTPMPFRPGEKIPLITREAWLKLYSKDGIVAMWEANPEADIAALLQREIMVLDADTP
jgi:hypothetical protein